MHSKYKLCQTHKEKMCHQLCIHPNCSQPSRWTCMECIQSKDHDHEEKLPQAHLKSRLGLKQFLEQEIQEKKMVYINQFNIVNNCIENFQKIFSSIQRALKELELILDCQRNYQTTIFQLEQTLKNLLTIAEYHQINYQNFAQVFDQDLTIQQDNQKLFNIVQEIHDQSLILLDSCKSTSSVYQGDFSLYFGDSRNKFVIDKRQIENQFDQLSNLRKTLDNIELNIQEPSQNHHKQIYAAKLQEYDQFKEIQIFESENSVYTSTISPNEKFLAFGGQDEYFQIHDLENKGKIKQLRLELQPTSSTFTANSQKIIIGGYEGEMICFDATKDFSYVFLAQVHTDRINAMICINNSEVLSGSNTNQIIITNLEQGEQILLITSEYELVYGLSYDFDLNNIFTGSQDDCIRIFNKDNRNLILQQDHAHWGCILQLQIIQKQNKLLSLCENGLFKIWLVDYKRKFLLEIQSIKEKNQIQNFLSLQNDTVLILISNNQIRITWKEQYKNVILEHQVKDFFLSAQFQADSLNMIVLRGECIYIFLQRLNQYADEISLERVSLRKIMKYSRNAKKNLKNKRRKKINFISDINNELIQEVCLIKQLIKMSFIFILYIRIYGVLKTQHMIFNLNIQVKISTFDNYYFELLYGGNNQITQFRPNITLSFFPSHVRAPPKAPSQLIFPQVYALATEKHRILLTQLFCKEDSNLNHYFFKIALILYLLQISAITFIEHTAVQLGSLLRDNGDKASSIQSN